MSDALTANVEDNLGQVDKLLEHVVLEGGCMQPRQFDVEVTHKVREVPVLHSQWSQQQWLAPNQSKWYSRGVIIRCTQERDAACLYLQHPC